MISISSDVLNAWVIGLLWPLARVLAMIAASPIFSHGAIPTRVQAGVGVLITLATMPMLPPMPHFDIISLQGLLILAQQILIGAAIGLSMRIVFSAVEMAGQLIGMTMGLGFATFFDPQSQGQSNAISQFLMLFAMLVFLSIDGHLLIISAVANSFVTIPISTDVGGGLNYMKIALWGEKVFSAGLLLALPAVAALLIANMALGVLTRTAPQLNIFGIGFPITISMGFIVIAFTLPGMLQPIQHIIQEGIITMNSVGMPSATPLPK
ncbi:MAG: flagellar biosynthetic protein FliR [Methylophilaceae bacterium]|uniref:flagellar biosynthetic protein FliR n=1 Tax=Methylovorus sp. MM2 TaxID=1848038 RepID=UPI0007DF057B|nr:flagellar biosynthetic protein FliR [Methylovorus sp. MM2]OAM51268.1 flagellar biosynthetic protein FliR [Methylovorus sp. MM2]